MEVNKIKVNISKTNPNGSSITIPKEVIDKFSEGSEKLHLLFLPFRFSKIMKSVGLSKKMFDANFEKSGYACSILTDQDYIKMLEHDLVILCGDDKKRYRYLKEYLCENTSSSDIGKFKIPFSIKHDFVGGEFFIITNDIKINGGKKLVAEIWEATNVIKLNEIIKAKKAKRKTTTKKTETTIKK